MLRLGFLALVSLLVSRLSAQEPPLFRSGTRLVEVEVVVRGNQVREPGTIGFLRSAFVDGPPFGPPGPLIQDLTKDDFTLLDNGKPQRIALFQSRASGSALSDKGKPVPLAPGVVSNRVDSSGQPSNNATVILIDQLNTNPDLLGYERQGVARLLRSLSPSDTRVALYTLGRSIHVLQDFTADPQRLLDLAARLDQPHGPPELAAAFKDSGGLLGWEIHDDASITPDPLGAASLTAMTTNALQIVIQHLARVPGRKSLVWLMGDVPIPPPVRAMLLRANIVLYPVMIRSVGCYACPPEELEKDNSASGVAAATGGRAFFDALDLSFAVHTAEEDSRSSYLLGFYPSKETLDGNYHQLAVRVRRTAAHKVIALNYRPGYLATKLPPPVLVQSEQMLLNDPLDATGIGLTARLQPDPSHPGLRKVAVNVDLHDVHLEPENGRIVGVFEIVMLNPAREMRRSDRITVNIPAARLEQALETGYTVVFEGIDAQPGEVRVVVRDPGTLAAGSLRVPIPQM
jgi:VWFA-related protein